MSLKYLSLGLMFTLSMSNGCASADTLKADSLDALVGNWNVEVAYANGAEATGTRNCEKALGGVYIRCTTSVVFSNDTSTSRESVNYLNFNPQRGVFEDVAMWQFPPAKKIMDVSGSPADGTLETDGYIYNGSDAPQQYVQETWSIDENEISVALKLNKTPDFTDQTPVFIRETLTRAN